MSIDDFYKIKSYAYLYKSIRKRVNEIDIDDLTITMVSSSYPEKMIAHIKQKQGIIINNEVEGIYSLSGSDIESQIIVIDELPKRENRYVRLLTKKMNIKDDINTFFTEYSKNYKDSRYEMLMEILYTANINQVVEVLEMAKVLTREEEQALDRLVSKFNLNKKWRDEEKFEIALNALKEGADIDFIVKITGLSKDDVLKLKEELK